MQRKFTAKVISNNRITIPKTTAELLKIKENDIVEAEVKKLE